MNTCDDVSSNIMSRVHYLQVRTFHSLHQCNEIKEIIIRYAFLCFNGAVRMKCAREYDLSSVELMAVGRMSRDELSQS
jgi:hypothetical protein